jgi:hypothetical protein
MSDPKPATPRTAAPGVSMLTKPRATSAKSPAGTTAADPTEAKKTAPAAKTKPAADVPKAAVKKVAKAPAAATAEAKPTTKKPPATRKSAAATTTTSAIKPKAAPKAAKKATIDPAELDRLIAEEAYYIAERRNFAPGSEHDDWMAAKAAVLQRLGQTAA